MTFFVDREHEFSKKVVREFIRDTSITNFKDWIDKAYPGSNPIFTHINLFNGFEFKDEKDFLAYLIKIS